MNSDLMDDDELKEINVLKLTSKNLKSLSDEKEKTGKASDNLHTNPEIALGKIKKNRNRKFKRLTIKTPIKTKIKTKADFDENKDILKNLENICLQLNQMDENLDNTLKWVSNVCIITILGIVVIIITMAAAAIIVINRFL